ncbi:MAG: hypothetical protein OEV28_10285 [Nitrospirota bacterium]|nr:hypothetical protein [Nitrospirota bacterium]
MKKIVATLVFSIFSLLSVAAHAGDFADVKAMVVDAREQLLIMLKDSTKRGVEQQKLVQDTADAVTAKIASLHVPKPKIGKHKQMAGLWEAFKKTRDKELVPAILAGKQAEAEKIAHGVQQKRLDKIYALCDELEKIK